METNPCGSCFTFALFEAGFKNLSHFSRVFKQRFGLRQRNNKKNVPHSKEKRAAGEDNLCGFLFISVPDLENETEMIEIETDIPFLCTNNLFSWPTGYKRRCPFSISTKSN
jgi:hypothetical protein